MVLDIVKDVITENINPVMINKTLKVLDKFDDLNDDNVSDAILDLEGVSMINKAQHINDIIVKGIEHVFSNSYISVNIESLNQLYDIFLAFYNIEFVDYDQANEMLNAFEVEDDPDIILSIILSIISDIPYTTILSLDIETTEISLSRIKDVLINIVESQTPIDSTPDLTTSGIDLNLERKKLLKILYSTITNDSDMVLLGLKLINPDTNLMTDNSSIITSVPVIYENILETINNLLSVLLLDLESRQNIEGAYMDFVEKQIDPEFINEFTNTGLKVISRITTLLYGDKEFEILIKE